MSVRAPMLGLHGFVAVLTGEYGGDLVIIWCVTSDDQQRLDAMSEIGVDEHVSQHAS